MESAVASSALRARSMSAISPAVRTTVWRMVLAWKNAHRLDASGALHGSLRHSVGGRDPQEGDDEDADNSFGRRGFGPRWADVAPAQARCGGTPVAGGGSGDPLAGAGRHRRDSDGMAGHLCGGR